MPWGGTYVSLCYAINVIRIYTPSSPRLKTHDLPSGEGESTRIWCAMQSAEAEAVMKRAKERERRSLEQDKKIESDR